MSAAPQSISGKGSGGAPVGGMLSPDGAPMPHSHETHLYAAASRPEALHVGGSVSKTRSGSPSSGAEARAGAGVGSPCWVSMADYATACIFVLFDLSCT